MVLLVLPRAPLPGDTVFPRGPPLPLCTYISLDELISLEAFVARHVVLFPHEHLIVENLHPGRHHGCLLTPGGEQLCRQVQVLFPFKLRVVKGYSEVVACTLLEVRNSERRSVTRWSVRGHSVLLLIARYQQEVISPTLF